MLSERIGDPPTTECLHGEKVNQPELQNYFDFSDKFPKMVETERRVLRMRYGAAIFDNFSRTGTGGICEGEGMRSWIRRINAAHGFTLLELLVVIAVISILASLLLPALMRSKETAYSAVCKNNLKQIALSTTLYVDDQSFYPVYCRRDSLGNQPSVWWPDILLPYTSQRWTNSLFKCPSYKGLWLDQYAMGSPCGSYSYNAYGTKKRGFPTKTPIDLGLGAFLPHASEMSNPTGSAQLTLFNPLSIPESRVRQPSDMIMFGDSSLVTDVPFFPGNGRGSGYDFYHVTSGKMPNQSAGQFLQRSVHQKVNVAFGDGHIESIKYKSLFEESSEARRRWNNDYEAHPETWF